MELPFKVNLRFRSHNETTLNDQKSSLTQGVVLVGMGSRGIHISPKELDTLIKFEPQLFKWLNLDKENVKLFAIDPLEALQKAGFPSDTSLFRKLKNIRKKNIRIEPPLVNIKLTKVTVEAETIKSARKKQRQKKRNKVDIQ